MTSVVLVRHGQASFGAADYDVLRETGRRQARVVVGEALRGRIGDVRAIVTGSMRRQRDTAAACLEAMGLSAPWSEDAAWNEFDHEEVLRVYEPRWADHAQLHRDLEVAAFAGAFERAFHAAVARWTAGAHDADYTETWPGFLARVDGALTRLPRAAAGTVLVFTSGGPISAACRATRRVGRRGRLRPRVSPRERERDDPEGRAGRPRAGGVPATTPTSPGAGRGSSPSAEGVVLRCSP